MAGARFRDHYGIAFFGNGLGCFKAHQAAAKNQHLFGQIDSFSFLYSFDPSLGPP